MRDVPGEANWDRRLAKRQNAALNVYLSGRPWLRRGTIRNISRRGLFVETNWLGLALGALVQLVFVQRELPVIRLRRYSAVVVRQNAQGLGLRFCWTPYLERIANVKLPR